MTNDIVKDKIRKCLALAKSSNENESKAALIMARKLMIQHKVSEAELKENIHKNVIRKNTGSSYTPRGDIWIPYLAELIAMNHCCISTTSRSHNKQTRHIHFVGFEADVEICIEVYFFALQSIMENTISKKPADRISYATGFIAGLDDAYNAQTRSYSDETAIVITIPSEVEKYCENMRAAPAIPLKLGDADSFSMGYVDGKHHLQKKLEHNEEAPLCNESRS